MNPEVGTIFVVDDHQTWRKLLVEILQDDGHNVKTATTFQEAISLLDSDNFDIAIIDMRLVDASEFNIEGMKVLKEAKRLHPSIKAIILTGYPTPEQKTKAIEYYHADHYLEKAPEGKPFDIDKFSRLIFELLEK